jgi:TolA-binding protein
MLDAVNSRFDKARSELKSIVSDFPDDDALRQQAQWDIAGSFLTQARVIASLSPTLARGQYVRSANELMQVAQRYHDHPQIGTIPQMLWNISTELAGRGYHDEAISVWNTLSINYPMHQLGQQAALQIAQTYQAQNQPLRAVEAYVELNFSRGGNDQAMQIAVYQIATDLKGKKRWVEALHVLETFIDSFPQHAQAGQALTMIGQIHQTNEAWEDAIAAYDRVIAEYAGGNWVQQARWAIAECTINLSRWRDAIDAYRKFAASYPKDAKAATAKRRIEVLKDLDRYQKVVDEKGQRKSFDAQYQIGAIVASQLANPVKSIIEYRKVATNWPKSHLADDALYQVGVTYLKLSETEKAREALLAAAEKHPTSPLADDALFMVGQSYEDEAQKFAAVTRVTSVAQANDLAQGRAYQKSQFNRRAARGRQRELITALKKQGKLAEADEQVARNAANIKAFDYANAQVIANWASQEAEVLSAAQLADRQDKTNAALRRAVASFRRAASIVSGGKADDALLRMAQIYDQRLKDADAAMQTWLEIVKQFSGTAVAEDASWKIAQYYEQHTEYAKAIDAYKAFLRNYRRSPKAGAAQAAIAENYEHLGQWVNAMDAYTNYLNNFPKGPLVARAKEQISWIKTYRL